MGHAVRAPTKAVGNVTTLSLPTDFYSLMRKAMWSLLDRGCWVTSHFSESNSAPRSMFQAPSMGRIASHIYKQRANYC